MNQPKFCHQVVEEIARSKPDSIALEDTDHSITYQELNERSNRLAAFLRQTHAPHDVRRTIRVGVCVASASVSWAVMVLALFKAGLSYSVFSIKDTASLRGSDQADLNLRIKKERIVGFLADMAGFDHLSGIEFKRKVPVHKYESSNFKAKLSLFPADNLLIRQKAQSEAYIVNSSGSTGKPKTICLPHKGLLSFVSDLVERAEITSDDVVAQISTLGFDASLQELLAALCAGARLHFVPKIPISDTRRYEEYFDDHNITVATILPNRLRLMISPNFPKLRSIILTGEPSDAALLDEWSQVDGGERVLTNGYGPSECTIGASLGKYRRGTPVQIGTPIRGTQMFVLDVPKPLEDGIPRGVIVPVTEPGKEGEIFIAGDGVGLGYLDESLTSKYFMTLRIQVDGVVTLLRCFRTRDRGMLNERGEFMCLGRLDSHIKIYGKSLYPEEAERYLKLACKNLGLRFQHVVVSRFLREKEGDWEHASAESEESHSSSLFTAHLLAAVFIPIEDEKLFSAQELYKILQEANKIAPFNSRWKIPNFFVNWPADKGYQNGTGKMSRQKIQAYVDSLEKHKRLQPTYPYKAVPLGKGSPYDCDARGDDWYSKIIAEIWRDILSLKDNFLLTATESFYDLGGDSLQIEFLLKRLSDEIRILEGYALADFRRDSTIRGTLKYIRSRATPTNTVLERKHGVGGEAVFLVHSITGNAENDYRDWFKYWEGAFPERPMYLVQAQHIVHPNYADKSVEDMVKTYMDAILSVQPDGLYTVVGWSSGGVFARMIAGGLRRNGKKALVIAIDTLSPAYCKGLEIREYTNHIRELGELLSDLFTGEFGDFTPKHSSTKSLIHRAMFDQLKQNLSGHKTRRCIELAELISRYYLTYDEPTSGSENFRLISASETQKQYKTALTLGWRNCPIVKKVEGTHHSIMESHASSMPVAMESCREIMLEAKEPEMKETLKLLEKACADLYPLTVRNYLKKLHGFYGERLGPKLKGELLYNAVTACGKRVGQQREAAFAIIRSLLGYGARPNLVTGPHSRTPMHEAAKAGSEDVCDLLLEYKAKAYSFQRTMRHPYEFVPGSPKYHDLRAKLRGPVVGKREADFMQWFQDQKKLGPCSKEREAQLGTMQELYLSLKTGCERFPRLLKRNPWLFDEEYFQGRLSIFHLAFLYSSQGAECVEQTEPGDEALQVLQELRTEDDCKTVIRRVDRWGYNILHYAAHHPFSVPHRYLLALLALVPDLITSTNNSNHTPLYDSVFYEREDLFDTFMEFIPNPHVFARSLPKYDELRKKEWWRVLTDKKNPSRLTLLLLAIWKNNSEMLKLIIRKLQECSTKEQLAEDVAYQPGYLGMSALHLACGATESLEICNSLLTCGADPLQPRRDTWRNCLHEVASIGNSELFEFFLNYLIARGFHIMLDIKDTPPLQCTQNRVSYGGFSCSGRDKSGKWPMQLVPEAVDKEFGVLAANYHRRINEKELNERHSQRSAAHASVLFRVRADSPTSRSILAVIPPRKRRASSTRSAVANNDILHAIDSGFRPASPAGGMFAPPRRSERRFIAFVASKGLTLHDVPADKNCFFRAVAHQLRTRYPDSHSRELQQPSAYKRLRGLTVGGLNVLRRQGRLNDSMGDVSAYITNVSTDGLWINGQVILTLARVLNATIVLINNDGASPTVYYGGDDKILYLGYQVGVHFLSTLGKSNDKLEAYVAEQKLDGSVRGAPIDFSEASLFAFNTPDEDSSCKRVCLRRHHTI